MDSEVSDCRSWCKRICREFTLQVSRVARFLKNGHNQAMQNCDIGFSKMLIHDLFFFRLSKLGH